MVLVAAVLLPLWLIVGGCMALSVGFCSDYGDDEACAAQRESASATAALGFVLIVGLLVWGLVRAHRNRPDAATTTPPGTAGAQADRPRNRKAVVAMVLASLGWLLPGIGASTTGSMVLWLAILVVGPLPALVLAWRARTEIRESGGRQSGMRLAWGATVVVSSLIVLGILTAFAR